MTAFFPLQSFPSVETVSWQRAAGVAVGLGSVGLCFHTVRVLGKETVGMSQAGTGGNTKAFSTGRTCNSFDLSLLSVCLPSSSLLQRHFIDASNHISLLALFSQTLLPLCFFSCLFSCFCNPCLPLQHPSPGRATAVFAATTAHHGQG